MRLRDTWTIIMCPLLQIIWSVDFRCAVAEGISLTRAIGLELLTYARHPCWTRSSLLSIPLVPINYSWTASRCVWIELLPHFHWRFLQKGAFHKSTHWNALIANENGIPRYVCLHMCVFVRVLATVWGVLGVENGNKSCWIVLLWKNSISVTEWEFWTL